MWNQLDNITGTNIPFQKLRDAPVTTSRLEKITHTPDPEVTDASSRELAGQILDDLGLPTHLGQGTLYKPPDQRYPMRTADDSIEVISSELTPSDHLETTAGNDDSDNMLAAADIIGGAATDMGKAKTATKGMSGGVPWGGIAIGAGNIVGSALSMTGGLISTSEKIGSDQYMQASHQTFQAARQAEAESATSSLSAQNFSQNSQLSAQSYQQTSNLMNQSLANSEQYNNYIIGQKSAALEQAGLPSYMAYGVPMGAGPKTSQYISGGATYTSKLPGNPTSSAYTGSAAQTEAGWGAIPPSQ